MARVHATTVTRLLTVNFPRSCFLAEGATAELTLQFAEFGISGGAVYDALVAATAAQHQLPLATRYRRALATYRSVDVVVELLD